MIDQKIRILIVDDEPSFREALSQMIEEQSDMEVAGEAEDGLSAIELYKKYKPDLVSTNIMMPVMGGFTMTKKIIEMDTAAKILICSARGEEEDIQKGLNLGAKGYITKPLSDDDYLTAVRDVARDEMVVSANYVEGVRMVSKGKDAVQNITGLLGCTIGAIILLAIMVLGNVVISRIRYGRQPLECSRSTGMCVYDVGVQFCPLERGLFGFETEWY